MNPRTRARETAFQFLYQRDLSAENADAGPDSNWLDNQFDHFKVPNEVKEFAKTLIRGTLNHLESLDQHISQTSKNWKINRISPVDRTILRLGAFELLHLDETPGEVVLDEAIELAKRFGTEESAAFVNGILDSIVKNLKS